MAHFFVTVVRLTTAVLGANTVLKQKKMFLETETSFPYCNQSTKMAGLILDVFRQSVSSLQGRGDVQGTRLQTISATDGLPWYPWAPNEGLACLQTWFHPSAQTELFDVNLDCHTVMQRTAIQTKIVHQTSTTHFCVSFVMLIPKQFFF